MKFNVSTKITVKFLDLDDERNRGLHTVRQLVTGTLVAVDAEDAKRQVRLAIETQYPCRWSLRVGTIRVEALAP